MKKLISGLILPLATLLALATATAMAAPPVSHPTKDDLSNQIRDSLAQQTIESLPPEIQEKIFQEIDKSKTTSWPLYPPQKPAPTPGTDSTDIDKSGLGGKIETETYKPGGTVSTTSPLQKTAAPEGATEKLSKIEEQYQDGYGSTLSGKLQQYGYALFADSTSKPSSLATPGPDYLLGPGDILRIRVWGSEIDADIASAIDRNGNINIPKIGIIPLAGVKFGQAEEVIRKEAEKYIQGINLNVSLEELRSVEVYVVGSVQHPGLHLVPAFSTVLDGLLATGGPLKSGSLRAVVLYRNGKPIREIDLYNLLLHGNRDFDVDLHDRDVIFVPHLQQTAAVAGAVLEEGIFELHGQTTVGKLLQFAGGILPQGFTGQMHLRRYRNNQQFVVQDIDTRQDESAWQNTPIHDGDLLELQYLPPENARTIRLSGHVWMPAEVKHVQGLKLSQMLTGPDLLKPDAVTDFALLYRYDPQTTRSVAKRFPLSEVFNHTFDMALQPFDNIRILSREELGISEQITIEGAVWSPGVVPFQPGLTLSGALGLAGGDQFGANLHRIELSRQEIINDTLKMQHIRLNIDQDSDFVLLPYDSLFIPRLKDATATKTVNVSGEVKYPGTYRITEGEHLSDIVQRAGGFLPSAYFFGAKYTSSQAAEIQQKSLNSMIEELEIRSQQVLGEQTQTAVTTEGVQAAQAGQTALEHFITKLKAIKAEGRVAIHLAPLDTFHGSRYDFTVTDGDTLHIPQKPNFVATVGSVFSPSAYLYETDSTIDEYLQRSGGLTKTADEDYIYVLRANGEVVSNASSHKGLFASFGSTPLMPGDTIVVPENLERVPVMRLIKDVADIMFKVATTAGVAIAAL